MKVIKDIYKYKEQIQNANLKITDCEFKMIKLLEKYNNNIDTTLWTKGDLAEYYKQRDIINNQINIIYDLSLKYKKLTGREIKTSLPTSNIEAIEIKNTILNG